MTSWHRLYALGDAPLQRKKQDLIRISWTNKTFGTQLEIHIKTTPAILFRSRIFKISFDLILTYKIVLYFYFIFILLPISLAKKLLESIAKIPKWTQTKWRWKIILWNYLQLFMVFSFFLAYLWEYGQLWKGGCLLN